MTQSVTQSAFLTDFYMSMAAWLDAGTPPHEVFRHSSGLCVNLERFCSDNGYPCDDPFTEQTLEEMLNQFINAGLCRGFPFNSGTPRLYYDEKGRTAVYSNPARLAWIRDHAAVQPVRTAPAPVPNSASL